MITIRKATEKDIPIIKSFIEGLAEYEKMEDECHVSENRLEQYLFGDEVYAHVLIAEYNGIPAGFSLYFFNFSTFLVKPGLYLEDLFVLPDFRGKGIGSALLKQLAVIAREKKCGRMEWAVLDWNKPAMDIYDNMGAKPQGEWITYRLTGKALEDYGK